jgi:Uma2 family endonuclease
MSTVTRLMTADELWALPRDHMRHELIRGELHTMPPAGFEHGAVELNLTTPLDVYVRANQLGRVVGAETGFLLATNPDTVRAPDIGFVSQNRIPVSGLTRRYWPGAPNLAVEVISPNDTYNEVDDKVEEWLNAGTELVWVVNPRRRTVTVYRAGANPVVLTANDVLDGGSVVPGFSIRVSEIFV